MEMDRTEIISSYRAAKDKRAQLGVLAELNLCGKGEIACLLLEAGEKVDGRWYASRGEMRPGRTAKRKAGAASPTASPSPLSQEEDTGAAAVPDGSVMLSRAEAEVLRTYMEATLMGWLLAVTDVDRAGQLRQIHALTGIWARLPGGDA